MKKRDFLVVYDYGQGGVWAVVSARSRGEIERGFPQLRVFEDTPGWMSETELKSIKKRMSFDLERPSGWLKTLVDQHGEERPPRPTAAG
jgi:hypothetical protein